MKILVSAYACDPSKGSEPNIGFNFAASLAAAGHDVWCVTRGGGRSEIEREVRARALGNLEFIYVDLPAWAERLYRFTPTMYVHYLAWQRLAARAAQSLDRRVDFELVHHVTWGSLQLGSGMWRVGKPLFLGPLGGGQFTPKTLARYFETGKGMELARRVASFVLTRFNKDHTRAVRQAACVIVSNADTERMALLSGARKVALVPDPVLPQSFFDDLAVGASRQEFDGEFRLLWVGRLMPRKGLNFALDAVARVSPTVPWKLTIVGDGPEAAAVDERIRTLGLSSRVVRLGSVPWSRMAEIYSSHDALLATPLRESVGVQLLEAMARGLPPITLDLHGASTFVPDNAGVKVRVTQADDTLDALATAIEDLWFNPRRLRDLASAARSEAPRYSWPNKVAMYEEVYRTCGLDTARAPDATPVLL